MSLFRLQFRPKSRAHPRARPRPRPHTRARPRRALRLAAAVVATATGAVLAVPSAAVAAPAKAGQDTPAAAAARATADDYCLGQCNDIMPPGENGHASFADVLGNKLFQTHPKHSDDQLGPYSDLLNNYSGLTKDQLGKFFNDSSFGVPADQVAGIEKPRQDVQVVRDKTTGIPHITGTTRSGTEFGAGYAGAQDRLFLMDVLRHVGRGDLTPFAGGASGNRSLEQQLWRSAPYTESDLQAQVDRMSHQGRRGRQLLHDIDSYLDGVNSYVGDGARPGEYLATGNNEGPEPFKRTDLVAIAGMVGGMFGSGGGKEMQSAIAKVAAETKFGKTKGDRVWKAMREQEDPEATTTVHDGHSFPYGKTPDKPVGTALPDHGSAKEEPLVYDRTGSAESEQSARPDSAPAAHAPEPKGGAKRTGDLRDPKVAEQNKGSAKGIFKRGVLPGVEAGSQHHGMSNALMVSGKHTESGHPAAVFGPQTGYFSPQLLMLQEIQGPGISARGASFAGLNFYVQMGRGPDYAWSATSGEQDETDSYAVPLCEPGGGRPDEKSTHYLFHGKCTAMDQLVRKNSWKPNLGDPTPAGSYTLKTLRTKYGLVAHRGTVHGKPVAFTSLRSTYGHEVDSAIGFQMFNDPDQMGSVEAFQKSASKVGYAFNWFYVNSRHTGYFNSGLNPQRAPGSDPNLPMAAGRKTEWRGWQPDSNTADYTPDEQHPDSKDQDYYVSWNNKQAKGYSGADGNFSFGPVQRVDLLDRPIKETIAKGEKFDRASLTKVMEDAANTDLRGKTVLRELLKVMGNQKSGDPATDKAVQQLRSWYDSGAHRRETEPGSKQYADADAIRIMDAWWSKLVRAEFRPGLGKGTYDAVAKALTVNESPSNGQQDPASGGGGSAATGGAHRGSAFQYGWWGYVSKDLRSVLGEKVSSPLAKTYCGDGSRSACRDTLLKTLKQAADEPASKVYPSDDFCEEGDQWCADSIVQSPVGGITQDQVSWQNRPTYQQVVSFPAGRGDNVTDLARGRTADAGSYQHGAFSKTLPASNAVDGDPDTRWASNDWKHDDQWFTVDLGSRKRISRAVLDWEKASASAYRIEVSDDGKTWRRVWSTTHGDGGHDNDAFSATRARYVRMSGVERATKHGYSLHSFQVYSH